MTRHAWAPRNKRNAHVGPEPGIRLAQNAATSRAHFSAAGRPGDISHRIGVCPELFAIADIPPRYSLGWHEFTDMAPNPSTVPERQARLQLHHPRPTRLDAV